MRFLKRLFRRRRRRSTADESARIAHELERCIADAERLVASRRHDEALRVARNALRRFPTSSRLRSVVSFVRREQSNGRISELKQLLQSRREERDYRELASIYLDLNRNDAASEIMQRYCDDFPNSSDAHAQRGEVCLACYFGELFARDAWMAMEHLERAVELNPECLVAQVHFAHLYYAVGAHRHCANKLAEVIHLDPANSRLADFRENVLQSAGDEEEDLYSLFESAENEHQLPCDPTNFPGRRKFTVENRGGTLDPNLFASAAAGIGRRLRIQQLAAIGPGGRPLAVAGEERESFVRLAVRIDGAARRTGRDMNFGTMRRFVVEGPFGRIVLVPAGHCAVAARAPRTVSGNRLAEGLETIVSASRAAPEGEGE